MAKLTHLAVDVLMVNGDLHEDVHIIGADRQRWTEISQRHKWPKAADDQDLWFRFLSWAALHRLGQYPGDYDAFCNDVSNYEPTDETAEAAGVDPTR